MTREQKILQSIDKSGRGLEVGPSYNPVAPKSEGWNVEIVDHLDADGLRRKYTAWSIDTSKIEDVDHIIKDRSLAETVGKRDHFDFVIASHVIEHTPDLISFLQDCQTLLKPDGILSLVVPDKRYCFDVFKPMTSTGMVFQAYLEKRKQHSPGTVFDFYAYHVMLGEQLLWFTRATEELRLIHDVQQSADLTRRYIESGEFIDVHSWHFTPTSFLLLLQDLSEMKLINLGVASSYPTEGFEFFVTLKKGFQSRPQSRIDMLRAIADELCASSSDMV
jgi:predicted SAM-dependent methyltransferase